MSLLTRINNKIRKYIKKKFKPYVDLFIFLFFE